MKVPIFPVTPKEAKEYGIENRVEANRNCPFAKRLAQLRQEKGKMRTKAASGIGTVEETAVAAISRKAVTVMARAR